MRLRAFVPAVHGFLDTIREGHPSTPLLVVSPHPVPDPRADPGPRRPRPRGAGVRSSAFRATGEAGEREATLSVIRDELAEIVAQRDDPNLHYLDGRSLYGQADYAELPLPDALHPDGATHRRIGERFAELAFGGPFA